ncbi:DUF4760 domain-containing protein [Pedobacter flavus]|uniref:DUF4760 domain-containing protein n=1 Tax=Pedobacter flavus TaxID=3113906 RepID=A0ABU7H426_9SPHI|nr:hypothetical protein [Pedobacter sp. VNH31]MEE1885346.1 hypothetical protein [Pedobacter sp. VNH31]
MSAYNDIIGILAQITTILGLAVIIFQIRQTTKWNRRASNYNFINTEITAKLESEARKKIEDLKISFRYGSDWQLTNEECKKIINNHDAAFSINQLLNDFQNLSAAYQENLLDRKMFKKIHSGRQIFWYRILSNYIEEAKYYYADKNIWKDFVETSKQLIKENEQ